MANPVLPYPLSIELTVLKDDGGWGSCRWFQRPVATINSLVVAQITLAHYEGLDEPAYTAEEWVKKSEHLVAQYPNCVFLYM